MSNPASESQIAEWETIVRRANAKRKAGDVESALKDLDAVLIASPAHSGALHSRARLALARGETEALAWFDKALKTDPGNADLWLGKAQALDVAGNTKGAQVIAQQICEQAPGFIAALEFLAGVRLGRGETGFAKGFAQAADRIPQDPNIPAAHVETLAGLDHAGAAADIAFQARARFPNEPHFALLEAANASADGQLDRAEAIFADLDYHPPSRKLHEARHRMRCGETQQAANLVESVLAHDPWNVAAWALRGIIWRIDCDERSDWLHEQAGLVQLRPLVARAGLIDDATHVLRSLHEKCAMPLSQSLRGGTQTRGVLFHRLEPVLGELREAILKTLEEYRAGLPSTDTAHPLLRHREKAWGLAGSWSVRLMGGGKGDKSSHDFHTAHIHPAGVLSSALYCEVPTIVNDDDSRQGWLELGRPPADLALDLEPIRVLKPSKGQMALFPSTLYHGTTVFAPERAEERITTAFDVVAATAPRA